MKCFLSFILYDILRLLVDLQLLLALAYAFHIIDYQIGLILFWARLG